MSVDEERSHYLACVRARAKGEQEPTRPTFAQDKPAALAPPVEPPESAAPAQGNVEPTKPLAKLLGPEPALATAPLTTAGAVVANEGPVRLADEERLITELDAIVPKLNRDSLVSLLIEARSLRQDQRR